MKRKNTFTGMAIFIAILILGVGYAAISDIPLNLNGTANVKANAEFVVEYDTDHTVKLSTDETIAWADSDVRTVVAGEYTDASNATMTVNLDAEHRSAYAIYKIDNLSEELKATVAAKITSDIPEEKKAYLQVEEELYTTEACDTVLADTQLAKNESAYLKVTVSLVKLPVEDITNAEFKITTTATPVEVTLDN
jgi:hypothetical protein